MISPGANEHSTELLYERVTAELGEQVRRLPEGSRIPTEPELMRQFGVSRTTIRRAVDAIVSDGLLLRRPPKGTFVTRPPFRHALDHPGAFLDTLMVGAAELRPSLTALRWVTADDTELPPGIGAEALYFERRYSYRNRPCALAEVYIADPFAREISRGDLEHTPSHAVFTSKLGITVSHTDATIGATDADAELAPRLGLDPGAPLIVLQRRMVSDADQVLQHSRHYLPAHRFELTLSHSGTGRRGTEPPRQPAVLRLITDHDHDTTEEPTA